LYILQGRNDLVQYAKEKIEKIFASMRLIGLMFPKFLGLVRLTPPTVTVVFAFWGLGGEISPASSHKYLCAWDNL
jgi:hypothetical protein